VSLSAKNLSIVSALAQYADATSFHGPSESVNASTLLRASVIFVRRSFTFPMPAATGLPSSVANSGILSMPSGSSSLAEMNVSSLPSMSEHLLGGVETVDRTPTPTCASACGLPVTSVGGSNPRSKSDARLALEERNASRYPGTCQRF
jgi:hypothetical protein